MEIDQLKKEIEKADRGAAIAKDEKSREFWANKSAKLKAELAELESKPPMETEPKPKKSKKAKKAKKGKGVGALLPDKPVKPIDDNDPDCQELLKKHRETAQKRRKAAKKRANKPLDTQVVETVERAADSVETKVEKMEDENETLDSDAVKKLNSLSDSLAKNIVDAIKSEKLRKQFITDLIEKLKKLL